MSANLHSRQNHCSRKHEIPEVPEFSFLPDCRACRKRGVPGFLPVWLPCKKPGNRVLFEISDWQLLAIGAGSQVGVFEAAKEQASPKMCLWVAYIAVSAKPVVPRFFYQSRAVFVTDKLCHTYRGSAISPFKLSLLSERLARFFCQLGSTSKAVKIKCQTPNRNNAKW